MVAPTISTLSSLAMSTAAASGTGPATQLFDFGDFSPGISSDYADGNRNRGSLDRRKNRTRLFRTPCQPRMRLEPTALEWSFLVPWIMGDGSNATTSELKTFQLGNTAAERYIQWYDGVANTDSLTGVAVRRATISTGGADGLLGCDLECQGRTFSTATSFASLTNLDNTMQPFVLPDTAGAAVLNGVATYVRDFSMTVENAIPERYWNSLTQVSNIKVDRVITISLAYPDGDFPTLWAGADAGIPVVITFTNAVGYRFVVTAADVRFPKAPRQVPVRGEVVNVLTGTCYESETAGPVLVPALTIGVDSTTGP